MDECLQILRSLADGTPVTFDGEFFSLDDALIVPAPSPPIPLIVGGRSDAAVQPRRDARRRLARNLGLAAPIRRGARSDREQAAEVGQGPEPASSTRSTSGAASAPPARPPASHSPTRMQTFYQMPFEPFERYSPYGTPEDVAEFLRPYIDAGCSAFNVIPCADDHETAVSGVAELRRLLGAVAS